MTDIACPHRWLVTQAAPEIYYERSGDVTYQGETGNLNVTVVCPDCERYRAFVARPEAES